LVKQAREEGDQRVLNLLAWFVDEQIEEENMFGVLVERLEESMDTGTACIFLTKSLEKDKIKYKKIIKAKTLGDYHWCSLPFKVLVNA